MKIIIFCIFVFFPIFFVSAESGVTPKSRVQIEYSYSGTSSMKSSKMILGLAAHTPQIPSPVKKLLLGMKVGETRSVMIPGYVNIRNRLEFKYIGIASITYANIPKKYLADTYEDTYSKADFQQAIFKCTHEKCGDVYEAVKNFKIGTKVNSSNPYGWSNNGVIKSVSGDQVLLSIENTGSPFYKKKKILGTKSSKGDFNWEIIGETENFYQVSAEWKKSPFYKKYFGVGAISKMNGLYVKVISIDEKYSIVTVQLSDENPEDLRYTVKLLKIL